MFDFPSSPADGQQYSPAGGPSYVWNAATGAWRMLGSATPVNVTIVESVLTSSGTWNKSAALSYMEVYVVGGGGGSCAAPATGAAQSSASAGGGGAGTAWKLYKASDLPASVAYTVGAAGTNGSANGGDSIFSGLTGGGGISSWTGQQIGPTGSYGIGSGTGGGAASGGDININGTNGGQGLAAVMGNAGAYKRGAAGSSFFAPGSDGSWGVTVAGVGQAGKFPGGGAMGAAAGPSLAAPAGANGGAGAIITREYYFTLATAVQAYVIGHRFQYVDTTHCALIPYNGESIRIQGQVYQLPPAGISITNAGLGVSSPVNYCYAYISGGAIALEFSTTGHSTDATAGNVGTEIKTGDPSRTLVGMVRTDGTGNFFLSSTVGVGVRSWLNRKGFGMYSTALGASTAIPVGTPVAMGGALYFLSWANEQIMWQVSGQYTNSTAGLGITLQTLLDGAQFGRITVINTDGTTRVLPIPLNNSGAVSEGFHTAAFAVGLSSGAANMYSQTFHTLLLVE